MTQRTEHQIMGWPAMTLLALLCALYLPAFPAAHAQPRHGLNAPIDVGSDFFAPENELFLARELTDFDTEHGVGRVRWERHRWGTSFLFNVMPPRLDRTSGNYFPGGEYEDHPALPFSISFVSPRTVRLQMQTTATPKDPPPSPMLATEPGATDAWTYTADGDRVHVWRSEHGEVRLHEKPWRLEIFDAAGSLLTDTGTNNDALPFSFVRRSSDHRQQAAASFSLHGNEKIVGYGESFGPLDKRGQKLVLYVSDALGAENDKMYKPIPFFLSSRGYGMFIHTAAPVSADVGSTYISNHLLMTGDSTLDIFLFFGEPKEVLDEYTRLVGKSAMPPLWSFGLWMSRITYNSEEQVRTVARELREHRIPSDVIHIDTGWFETDWRNDYRFAESRFDDPKAMMDDLDELGFHVSLWQLPYFVPKNALFDTIVERGLAVKDAQGGLPAEDAVLDFTNPRTVDWYQEKLRGLLEMGVGAIKVDFGEAAPANGLYANGSTGLFEHNLYPLRYQQAVAEVTRTTTGEDIMWARSAWAGSQRFAVHWSGDSHVSDTAMAATLRAGLSLGTCGFSFWSHDIGGFFGRPGPELYERWAAWGMLTSHSRTHGNPPREPWTYDSQDPDFEARFRRIVEMKYRLMPYVYAQAKDSSERGLPMLRALYIEFPDDPGSWLVEDQYLFGSSMLVAPMLEADQTTRDVYLPPGVWFDYQTGERIEGSSWVELKPGEIPAVILVRSGTLLPHVELAQSTSQIDWSSLEVRLFADDGETASGLVCFPNEGALHTIKTEPSPGGGHRLVDMPTSLHDLVTLRLSHP